ncbi:hypothetical protein K9M41_03655 [Candidatus Gracilibacteria bacterium]|nr:hypothetical protein [Candidatus Gracilibacteria bacterium]
MDKELPDVLIGQGIGDQQQWSFALKNILEGKGLSVWNEKLSDAQLPLENTPKEWSVSFEPLISQNLTAILHSASAISFLHALIEKGEPIENIFFLAAWLKDPSEVGDRITTRRTQKIFTQQGAYLLQPFLELADSFISELEKLKNIIRNKIIRVMPRIAK